MVDIGRACRKAAVAAFVGVPTLRDDRWFNSYVCIAANGERIGCIDRTDSQPAEATLFAPAASDQSCRFYGHASRRCCAARLKTQLITTSLPISRST